MQTAQLNELSHRVIGAGIAVHRDLGPGLEEEDYQMALSAELTARQIEHTCECPQPLTYKGIQLDIGYRIDVFAERNLILELKSTESLQSVHTAQLLTYLRLSECRLGLLMNFNVATLKDGIQRRVFRLEEDGIMGPRKMSTTFDGVLTNNDVCHDLSGQVIAAAIEVHRHLGPGLLRSAYEECVCYELSQRDIPFVRQKPLGVRFRDLDLPRPTEVQLLIAEELPVMISSTVKAMAVLEAQLNGQLKLGSWENGLLLNFGANTLAQGIRKVRHPATRK